MITIERIEPIEKAFDRLRAAPLDAAPGEPVYIYQHAQMRLAEVFPDDLTPILSSHPCG